MRKMPESVDSRLVPGRGGSDGGPRRGAASVLRWSAPLTSIGLSLVLSLTLLAGAVSSSARAGVVVAAPELSSLEKPDEVTGDAAATSGATLPPEELSLVGHIGGPVRAVIADATTAWISEGIGFSRLDISRGEDVRLLGHHALGLSADVWSLARHGRTLYAGASDGLHVVDVSEPTRPIEDEVVASAGAIRAISVYAPPGADSHWLFLTDEQVGVRVVESTSDGDVLPVAALDGTGGSMARVALDGTQAVVPADDAMLFDVTDPSDPVLIGRVSTAGRVRGVAASAGWAFISDSVDGLLVVPLGGPLSPVARLANVGSGRVYLRGPSLYIIEEHESRETTLRLIDVSDPTHPRDVLGGESTYSVLRGSVDLALLGDRLLAARTDRVSFVDVSDRHWPAIVADHQVTWPLRQLAAGGRCAYAARGVPGMDVVRIEPPADMLVLGAWRPPGGTSGVHVSDHYLYVSDEAGFGRFDSSDPCEIEPRELPFAPNWAPTSWIASEHARLVASTPRELYVADLRGDDMPRERSRTTYENLPGWPATGIARDVVLHGPDLAYVAAGGSGLAVVSLVDPSRPVLRRLQLPPEGLEILSLALGASDDPGGGRLLVAGTSDGVLLYDTTDPLAPGLLRGFMRGVQAVDVFLDGDLLFVAADLDGLMVVDLSDRDSPTVRASIRPPYSVSTVITQREEVLAAGSGLLVLTLRHVPVPTPTPVVTQEPARTPTFEPTPTPGSGVDRHRRVFPLVLK